MLGKNEWLVFKTPEVEEIEKILSDFAEIVRKLGFEVETGTKLTSDNEVIQLYYTVHGDKKCNYYRKTVVSTWKDLCNEVKADLFGEIKKFVQMK